MTTFLLTLVRHGTTDSKKRISKAVVDDIDIFGNIYSTTHSGTATYQFETTQQEHNILGNKENALSRKGYCQADLLGQRLKFEKFSHIYCSDISKAKETAVVIANHNRSCSNIPIHEDPRLEEMRSFSDNQETQSIKNINNCILDKLETLDDIRHRAEDFFQEMCEMVTLGSSHEPTNGSQKAHVLVVSHKGLIREMLRYFCSELSCILPRRSGRRANWNSSYTGVSVFSVTVERTDELFDNIRVECLLLNDNSHLNRRSNDCSDLESPVSTP